MRRCKFCGEVIDVVGTNFCPICGNDLNDEPNPKGKGKTKNGAKPKAVPPLKDDFPTEVVVDNGKGAVSGVSGQESGGVRASYIFFGVMTLLIALFLLFTSGYRLFEVLGLDSVAEKINFDIFGKLEFGLFNAMGTFVAEFLFLAIFALITVTALLTLLFSFMHSKQSLSSVFAKLTALTAIVGLICYMTISLSGTISEILATTSSPDDVQFLEPINEFLGKVVESVKMPIQICGFASAGLFLFTMIFSFVNHKKAYRSTLQKGFRALWWTALVFIVALTYTIDSLAGNEIIGKIVGVLFYGFPFYLLIDAILYFTGAKYRGVKRK